MTKARQPDSLPDAMYAAIAALGNDRVADVVERARHHVYRWADPDPGGDRPNVEQALRIDVAMLRAGHAPPFLAAWQAQLARVDAPPQVPKDPRDRLAAIMAEVGDVAAEIARGGADGRLSAADIAAIARQAKEARDTIDDLLRDLEAGPRLVGGRGGASGGPMGGEGA